MAGGFAGIGLGAFTKGFGSGIGIGAKLNNHFREQKERKAFEGAIEGGRSDFDAAVTAGEATAGDPDGPMRYAMPRIVQPLLAKGDLDGAEAAAKWVRSDKTRQGARFFANGMLKGQNGDMKGALDSFVAAGRVQGYGYDFEISDPIPIEGGGFKVNVKDQDGNERSQVFNTPDEVLQFGSVHANPEAAFKQWQTGQTAKSEDAREIAKAGGKKRAEKSAEVESDVVRRNLGLTDAKTSDLVSARKQAHAELKETDGFLDSTSTQQAEMIERRAQEISGGGRHSIGATPPKRLIVDTRTGKLVEETQ